MRIVFLLCSFLSPFFASELITPLPLHSNYDKSKAILGKKLFFDPILSKDNTISCAHCHNLQEGGDDGLEVSVGIDGKLGSINSPTVLNAVYNIAQFWDGRAKDLQAQAIEPIHNSLEMGIEDTKALLEKLKNNGYEELFFEVYVDGLSLKNLVDAIAEFEKALITPNSRFDRYLKGENSLSEEEVLGYKLFKSTGCISCHNGVLLGGNFYQKVGIYEPYYADENLGRFSVTKLEEDKYYFKVPTLRNIAKTAPYLHHGKVTSLKDTIQIMAYHQLGKELETQERDLIYKFLLTLDGDLPEILNEK